MNTTPIRPATRLKWYAFRVLEMLSDLRARLSALTPDESQAASRRPLWLYVSTIGELNAIEPFLKELLAEMGAPPLVLLTDHLLYEKNFLDRYPSATVSSPDRKAVAGLAAADPPALVVLAEIPCELSDAPCRFPFAVLFELKQRNIPVCVVNGWLYHGSPACTLDAIEKRLFGRDYLQLIDLMAVQDEATRDALIAEGADPLRVFVTGNTKFDAIDDAVWDAALARSPALLQSIRSGERPTIVGGCVTNIAEQALVLDAFVSVRRSVSNAFLVLAPRHPEVAERMQKLREMLDARALPYAFRSQCGDIAIDGNIACLVLDTIGELKDFYAAGTIAYVGLNHNVLEPLAFAKPVVVTPGWEPNYPSFPVYKRLLAQGAISQVEPEALASAWLALLHDPTEYSRRVKEYGGMLASLKGAVRLDMALLARFGLFDAEAEKEHALGNPAALSPLLIPDRPANRHRA